MNRREEMNLYEEITREWEPLERLQRQRSRAAIRAGQRLEMLKQQANVLRQIHNSHRITSGW